MKFSKLHFAQAGMACLVLLVLTFNSCNRNKNSGAGNEDINVQGKQIYSDTSSSTVRVFDQNGRVCVQQTNTYYEVANLYEGSQKIPLLLKIRKTDLCYADSVNKQKVFEISAKSIMDTKPVVWQAKFMGTAMQFKDNTIVVNEDGKEDEDDYLQRFSLADGRQVFNCSRSEMTVGIPNVKDKRYIGYTSKKTASQPLDTVTGENLIGVIHYASGAVAGQALKVELKRSKLASKISLKAPDMVLVALNDNTTAIDDGKAIILMKAGANYKPADVKDFAVKFTYYYGDDNESTNITIPVVDDQLNLAGAKYDKDIFAVVNY